MRKKKDSGIEWIGEIPSHWKLERLQWHITEIKESNKPEKSKQVLSLTNKRGVIPYEEKGAQGNIAKEDYSQYKLAYPGTIVANSMNILIGSVGRCDYFGCVSPVYYVYKPNEGENLEFISYMFQMERFQKELRRYANGILEIRLRVSSDGILKREMAFPPISEQERIVSFLDGKLAQVDALVANVEAQIEKLKAYKQSLITEVVTKGLDPSVPMKDSGVECVGTIPAHWELCRVRNIGIPQNGISKGGEYFGEGYPFVTYGDVYRNFSLPENPSGLIRSTLEEQDNYSVCEGDIFFTRTSETIEEVGFSCVCEKTLPNATFAGFLIRLRPFNDDLVTQYAKYYFRSNHLRLFLVKEMNIVTRASLGQNLLKNIPVLLLPKAEQHRIAEELDLRCGEIDQLIAIKQKKIDKLNEYKKSLIYEYVTGKREVS